MQYERKLTFKYSLLQWTFWMIAASAMAFLTPILEAKGFSAAEIGVLNTFKYISVMVFQLLLGSFADRHVETVPLKIIINMLSIVGLLATLLFLSIGSEFWLAVIVVVLFGATIHCLEPMIDALSLHYMNTGRRLNYTVSRAAGSGSWALFCILLGILSERRGMNALLVYQAISLGLMVLMNTGMDKVDVHSHMRRHPKEQKKGRPRSVWELIRDFPKYRCYLLACLFVFAGFSMNTLFLIDKIHLLGGTQFDYGLIQFVIAAAEIPLAIFFYRVRKKISLEHLMVLMGIFCTVRAFATAAAQSVWVLILAQSFELVGLSVYYAGSVFFIQKYLPEADAVKGTSILNLFANGIGNAIASTASGFVYSHYGFNALMLVSIVVSAVSLVFLNRMLKAPAYTGKKEWTCQNEVCRIDGKGI